MKDCCKITIITIQWEIRKQDLIPQRYGQTGPRAKQIDYIFWSWRWRSSIHAVKPTLGADCGSDHELLIAKFRLKLKKVGKSTRPFRYNLNQIPYDHMVEVTNRLKGLDLIDRVPKELWTEVCDIVQKTGIKNIPMEKKCKKDISLCRHIVNSLG